MRCCAKTSRFGVGALALTLCLLGGVELMVGTAHAGTPIDLYATHAGHVNFVGTAGSLRRGSNLGDACAVDNYDSAPLNDLPAGAVVKAAYLYWAGSYADERRSNQRTPADTIKMRARYSSNKTV